MATMTTPAGNTPLVVIVLDVGIAFWGTPAAPGYGGMSLQSDGPRNVSSAAEKANFRNSRDFGSSVFFPRDHCTVSVTVLTAGG
jgi:hypothetical protein